MPIEETKSDPNGPCSVNKLLELYDEMIVPHFQRGLVWDKSSVSLLLESLYCKTPCGLIILWTPTNPQQEGVPLGENPRYLIVDGQQRIRCLWTVFKGGMDESIGYSKEVNESAGDMENEGTEEDGERNRVWCLNLGRVYELEKDFTGGKRFSLFRLANDPRKDTKDIPLATIRDREALLPLRWFLDHTDEEIAVLVEKSDDGALKKAVNAVLGNDVVKKTLRDMLSYNHFHVSTLNTMYKLEDVIGIYNRINSAGKRVESEEKAFANVVSVYPDVNKKLEEFYKSVHPLAHSKNLSDKLS